MTDKAATPAAFVHPVTGVLTEATVANLRVADREAREIIGRLYRALEPVREGLVALTEPELPEPTRRTDVQNRVARCPRCGRGLDEPFEGA